MLNNSFMLLVMPAVSSECLKSRDGEEGNQLYAVGHFDIEML